MQSDFSNLAVAVAIGEWYFIEHSAPPQWRKLPLHTIFVRAEPASWCFRGICYPGEFEPSDIL
jgi:hypothetical protein